MAALYKLKDIDVWAKQSLEAAGYELTLIQRTFPATDEEDVEVLYLDGAGDPRTAYLMPDGTVLATRPGF